MKAYLKNTSIELEVRSFRNDYNKHGASCLMCDCYVKAFDTIETIPAGRIEIR